MDGNSPSGMNALMKKEQRSTSNSVTKSLCLASHLEAASSLEVKKLCFATLLVSQSEICAKCVSFIN